MGLNNKYFSRGLLFILLGIMLVLWGIDIIHIGFLGIVNMIAAIFLIHIGDKHQEISKIKWIGYLMILLMFPYYLGISLKFVLKILLAVIFICMGLYMMFVKSNILVNKKGEFKDSRENVFIKERFSHVVINNSSKDLSHVKLIGLFSDITVNFDNSQIVSNNSVDFEVSSFLSSIKINVNPNWSIIVNGQYLRKVEMLNSKIVNIRLKNILSTIDIG